MDRKALTAPGQKGLVEILASALTGMTLEEFEAAVVDWIATARHPKYKRPLIDDSYASARVASAENVTEYHSHFRPLFKCPGGMTWFATPRVYNDFDLSGG